MTLDAQTIDAIAEAVARKQARYKSPVLTRDEAMAYVGKASEKAFRDWRKRWRVGMCSDGRYSRRALDGGLSKEARNRHKRAET